ncbi:hypothetical protein B0A55_00058 [Friedmanniomyces simplex]|uniref:Uncharacterized protein n=1 Tax=Friedmanniomyces simplex TaxID=329884 RepID=A0A4U0Y696_9PEZI|nr:hypothetical protein B0A55_00058 [Friedmanniomyces simplex]
MSLTFKLLSLAIRTAAKPIGNYIKRQAKEHDGFRRFAIQQAQRVHQVDMRMRLGILHDAEAQQRMHEREQKAAEERKRKAEAPTVRSEEEQKKHEEDQARAEREGEPKKKPEEKKEPAKLKIRPLSESKAIELGANFFSEAFIFAVAAGLLVWDSWRSRRKESARRDDVAEKLAELEAEVGRLRIRYEPQLDEEAMEKAKPDPKYSWYNPAGWWKRTEPLDGGEIPQVPDESGSIPGNVPIPPASTPGASSTSTVAGANKNEAKERKTAAKETNTPAKAPPPAKASPERVDAVTAEKEQSQLETHDIAIPVEASVDPTSGTTITRRYLRYLLLAPSSVDPVKIEATLDRIQHFASLTGGQDLAIIFLLQPPPATSFIPAKQLLNSTNNGSSPETNGVYAYTLLQATLMDRSGIPYIPILPLATLASLPDLLKGHSTSWARSLPKAISKPPTPMDLLQLCTANPPMPQQTTYFLSDLFPNLRELAVACTSVSSAPASSSPSARAAAGLVSSQDTEILGLGTQVSDAGGYGRLRRLRDLVGEQQCRDVVDFWQEEWTAD